MAPAPGAAEAFASPAEAGTSTTGSAAPAMLGDFLGPLSCTTIDISASEDRLLDPLKSHIETPGDDSATVCVAGAAAERGAFKISDNESPRPVDRIFSNYEYFRIKSRDPNVNAIQMNRYIEGFEKTFMDGKGSIGLRLPIFQVWGTSPTGDAGVLSTLRHEDVGDLTIVTKYAFWQDCDTGSLLSGGLVVTTPTGPDLPTNGVVIHSTLIQPWVGGIYNTQSWYLHGFTAIIVPTDERDVTFLTNDYGIGYYLYQAKDCGKWLSAITPTFEIHVNTPLNHRGTDSTPIGLADIVDLTGGATLGIGRSSTLALGAVTPITGPRPFQLEAQVFFNYHF
jgi:hypothetical protein